MKEKTDLKTLKVRNGTYERLAEKGKWKEDMDDIINRTLDEAAGTCSSTADKE